jgi:hypothetical protein
MVVRFLVEHCSKEECINREQFYLDSYRPEYNISKFAHAPTLGLKMSAETKLKMSLAQVGKKYGSDVIEKCVAAKGGSKIYCVELDKIYLGIRPAAKELGLRNSSIHRVLEGQRKTTGGYTFVRIKEKVA